VRDVKPLSVTWEKDSGDASYFAVGVAAGVWSGATRGVWGREVPLVPEIFCIWFSVQIS